MIIADSVKQYKNKDYRNFDQGIKKVKGNSRGRTPCVIKKDGSCTRRQDER